VAETARTRSWVYQLLTGDATLAPLVGTRVYNGIAPAGATFPYVVMQLLSGGNDLMGVGPTRIWADMLWLIKAVTKGSSTGPLEPIANRIDALLHAASGTVSGGVVHICVRERPFELPTVENGVSYVQLGAEYRVKVSEA
jgi:hypothetical protein